MGQIGCAIPFEHVKEYREDRDLAAVPPSRRIMQVPVI